MEHGGREALDEGMLGEWNPEEDTGGRGAGAGAGAGGGGDAATAAASATATRESATTTHLVGDLLENPPSAETEGSPGTSRGSVGRAGHETSGRGHQRRHQHRSDSDSDSDLDSDSDSERHPKHPFKDIVSEQGRHAHLLDREWNPTTSRRWGSDRLAPNGEYVDDTKYWVRIRGNKIAETRTGWIAGQSHLEAGGGAQPAVVHRI